MSNFIINTVLNGSPELSRDGGVTFETVVGAKRMERNAASVVLHISENKDVITITPAKDSITINQTATGGSSVTYAPTDNSLVSILTLHRTLNPLFPNGKSSSAGSGEVALTDASTIDLTASKQTLASSASSRTFTVSYTGDEITLRVTLSAATATYTFPSGALCVSEGVSSGSNAMIISGTSGDKYIIVIKKMTNIYYVVSKNFSR